MYTICACNSICVIVALFIWDGGSYRINVNCMCYSHSVNTGTCFVTLSVQCLHVYMLFVCLCASEFCALLNEHVWMVFFEKRDPQHNYRVQNGEAEWDAFSIKKRNLTASDDMYSFSMFCACNRIFRKWSGDEPHSSELNEWMVIGHFKKARISSIRIELNCTGFELEITLISETTSISLWWNHIWIGVTFFTISHDCTSFSLIIYSKMNWKKTLLRMKNWRTWIFVLICMRNYPENTSNNKISFDAKRWIQRTNAHNGFIGIE